MEIARGIRKAIDTGSVIVGTDKSLKAVKTDEAKLVIYAANCKKESKDDLMHYTKMANIPTLEFVGTGMDLGMVCGKPFIVSMLAVISPGDSSILAAEGA